MNTIHLTVQQYSDKFASVRSSLQKVLDGFLSLHSIPTDTAKLAKSINEELFFSRVGNTAEEMYLFGQVVAEYELDDKIQQANSLRLTRLSQAVYRYLTESRVTIHIGG